MNLRLVAWVAVPILVGSVVYAARTARITREWSAATRSAPFAEFPARVDLGDREIGDEVTAEFAVANRGGGMLTVEDIRANCSCSAVERDIVDRGATVESLQIKSGESVPLRIRIAVRSQPNRPMRNVVQFRTNDSTQPLCAIEFLVPNVRGGVTTYPAEVLFGTVPVGKLVRQILDIYDMAEPCRAIERVTSSDPSRVSVRLLPPEPSRSGPRSIMVGTLIGHLEVTVQTESRGAIEGAVQVHVAGRVQPDPVRVSGRVTSVVEVLPAAVSLPRASGEGPLYFAKCLCRSVEGEPLTISVVEPPPGLTAEVLAGDPDASTRIVKITWDNQIGKGLAGGPPQSVRLRAMVGGAETTVEVPVTCRAEVRP